MYAEFFFADGTKKGARRDTNFIQKCNIMDGTVKHQQLDTTAATYQHCTQQQFMMYTGQESGSCLPPLYVPTVECEE
jgi:hypothetical protein